MKYFLSKNLILLTLVLSFALTGCQGKEPDSPVNIETESNTPSAPLAAVIPAGDSQVSGEILFSGEAPAPRLSPVTSFTECAIHHPGKIYSDEVVITNGKLKNVFVYVKEGLQGSSVTPPSEPVTMDQVGCIYTPHVIGIQTGQTLLIKNSDTTLHNIHSHSVNQKPFNIGMPVQGMKIKRIFEKPEVMVSMTCDVHSWMKSYIGVLSHPFFSVSDENGQFSIKNMPAGDFVIEAWHEKFGTLTQSVHLDPHDSKKISFTFEAKKE